MKRTLLASAAALALVMAQAQAADRIKLGFLVSLSGAGAGGAVGEEQRRGLDLALTDLDNKLGGVPVTLFTVDDKGEASTAVQVASKLIDEDQVDIVTGFTASFSIIPTEPNFLEAGIFVVGALAGPQEFAGKACSPNAFHTSFENEDWDDVLGKYIGDQGIKSVYFMAADYQAGWEKIGGAIRNYKGKVYGPVYTPFTQLDLAAEISQLRAANPEAVFVFYPGAIGIAFLKQFAQAGLHDKIRIYSEDTLSSALNFAAEGDAALGIIQSTSWSDELDNPANRKFVAEFEQKYGRPPAIFAALQYDAINLIDSAVAAVHGDIADKTAFRAALRKADFHSIRGPFKFNNNQYPIQNIYLTEVEKDSAGKMKLALKGIAAENWQDAYHQDCKMK